MRAMSTVVVAFGETTLRAMKKVVCVLHYYRENSHKDYCRALTLENEKCIAENVEKK